MPGPWLPTFALVLTLALGGCVASGPGFTEPSSPEVTAPTMTSEPQYPVYDGTWDEWAEEVVACMREQGWSSRLGDPADGISIVTEADDSQYDAMDAAYRTCYMQIGRIPEVVLDEATLTAFYDDLLAQYECLVNAGFTPEPPTTLEVFIERYLAGGEPTPWVPLSGMRGPLIREANAVCPEPTTS